jgi:hypothetical protein
VIKGARTGASAHISTANASNGRWCERKLQHLPSGFVGGLKATPGLPILDRVRQVSGTASYGTAALHQGVLRGTWYSLTFYWTR